MIIKNVPYCQSRRTVRAIESKSASPPFSSFPRFLAYAKKVMLVTFLGEFLEEMSAYALDFWCGEIPWLYFSPYQKSSA